MLYNPLTEMRSHEIEPINLETPNTNLIKELRSRHLIKDGSPLWWSTDYAPDPREYMPFDEFLGRLVHIGESQTTTPRGEMQGIPNEPRDVYLYPEPKVPMSVMELDVDGLKLPLLITARPYHKKELDSRPFPFFLHEHPSADELPDFVSSGGVINLPIHFYPHIRGLFAGKRGDNYFWYHLRINSNWWDFGRNVMQALAAKGLPFIDFYEPPMSEERTYSDVWRELEGKAGIFDQRSPKGVDFPNIEVSPEEFIENGERSAHNLTLLYPLQVDGISHTLPLFIANRTHNRSKIKKPVILGVYAENGDHGNRWSGGILRIKDRHLAESVSKKISEDFGMPVDALLFTPQKGSPKYERVVAL